MSKRFYCHSCGKTIISSVNYKVTCPDCKNITAAVFKTCRICGKEFVGSTSSKSNTCRACASKMSQPRSRTRQTENVKERLDKVSIYSELVAALCSKAPACVHKYIKQEAACREDLAKKIATVAKTETQAKAMIDAADYAYIHAYRTSVGVANYGGF